MPYQFADRYPGTRWLLVYGKYAGPERVAANRAQTCAQYYLPHVLEVAPAADVEPDGNTHLILVGTAKSNRWIAQMIDRGLVKAPEKAQGFTIACLDAPWGEEKRCIVICGADARGMLYGAEEFCARTLYGGLPNDGAEPRRDDFDHMADFALTEAPAIDDRGIWTWGYVIYDYKRFLDHMVKLKMNMLTVWNRTVPVNMDKVIEYAHARGIRIVTGFHWGWGSDINLDISRPDDLPQLRKVILETYRREYAGLDIDGIYFQTQTEHHELTKDGRTMAAIARDFVNYVAEGFYQLKPELFIQFGLHATSIREHYADFDSLDPRITITWEDAGVLPFSYFPSLGETGQYEETLAYGKQLAQFRRDSGFAMVPKGWTCLRWGREFEFHGPFILGERSPRGIHERLLDRSGLWEGVNQQWYRLFPHAARFYREILEEKPKSTLVTGLVEDGIFEEAIQPSVALFAETLWNPYQPDDDILVKAMRAYYKSA